MHAPVDAARHVENALDVWDRVADPEGATGTTLVELLRRGAELSFIGGEMDRAVGLARRALDLIDDSEVVTTVLARERLARYLWTSGHHSESMEQYTRAAELMPVEPPSAERALVLGALAQARMLVGQIEVSLQAGRRGARDRPGGRGPRCRVPRTEHARGGHRRAWGPRGRHRGAQGIARHRAGAHCRPTTCTGSYTNLGDILDQDGQLEEAIQLALEGVEKARETGSTRSWAGFLLARGRQAELVALGAWRTLERLVQQALNSNAEGVSGGERAHRGEPARGAAGELG